MIKYILFFVDYHFGELLFQLIYLFLNLILVISDCIHLLRILIKHTISLFDLLKIN